MGKIKSTLRKPIPWHLSALVLVHVALSILGFNSGQANGGTGYAIATIGILWMCAMRKEQQVISD